MKMKYNNANPSGCSKGCPDREQQQQNKTQQQKQQQHQQQQQQQQQTKKQDPQRVTHEESLG